jgi:uncharacterized repeat protein (TIGR03803 family)
MNNPTQHRSWILGIRGRVAGAALALAIMLVPAVLGTRSAQAQTYTESVLYSFTGPPDGANPFAGLVRDAQGNLYGTTASGGDLSCDDGGPYPGCGMVFKLDTTGKKTVLYSFTGTGWDGTSPVAGLVRDAQGNLYGTTAGGGDLACGGGLGCGTVFKLDTTGKETVLYSFTGTGGDGSYPEAGLVRDAQGNLYGTTAWGGVFNGIGYGTVFKVDTTGKETVLANFGSPYYGLLPVAGLVRDAQGNLYGTTEYGGNGPWSCNYAHFSGCGVVFKVDTTGGEMLHIFTGTGGDGAYPRAGLVLDAQGNLYGTTWAGGDPACESDGIYGCGTVFKVDTTGEETVLYSFTGTGGDGAYPRAGLVRDAQGNLYGTTYEGGAYGVGTVFKVDPAGKETVLYTFTGTGGDGAYPTAGLVRDAQGNLYGTTYAGGDPACIAGTGCGTVFKLTPAAVTTTTLTSSPNPSTYGQAVTFTAAVTSKIGAPPDGETVSFMKGKTVLGTGTLSGGSASFTTSTLKVGTNAIKAVYGGDSNFAGSTSKTVSQVVSKATTTTTLASSQNPSNSGQSVTFTASVAPQFSGTPTGTVTFNNGSTKLGTVPLSGGVASYTTTNLAVGTEPITASYNGSSSFTTSTSGALSQAVNQANTTTTLVSSLNPSNYKQAVTFTATVSPQFSGTVTGTVTFYDGTTLLKTVTLSGGKAKCTTSKLTSGVHSIKATYNGSTDFTGSSGSLTQTVN